MPVQLFSEPVPGSPALKCNLVAFHPEDGELPFFSWSNWDLVLPGISRDGISPPFMRTAWDPERPWSTTDDPEEMRRWSFYIDEDGVEVDRLLAMGEDPCGSGPLGAEQRQLIFLRYLDGLRGAVHTVKFRDRYPGKAAVGQMGCADTTMNLWHVAFVWDGDKPKFLYLEDEPIREREYPCLVSWVREPSDEDRNNERAFFSVELGVRFVPDIARPQVQIGGADRKDQIGFAVSGKPLLNNLGDRIPPNQVSHFFRDLRHLFSLPKLTPTTGIGPPVVMFGQPITADLWFGEKQLLDDFNLQRAACLGPVLLDRLYGGLSVTREYLRNVLLGAGYTEGANWVELREGQFRIDLSGTGVEIWFRQARYPWNIIAVGKYRAEAGARRGQKVLLSFVCGGRSGRSYYTLNEAVATLKSQAKGNHIDLEGALLLDEGGDVFQKVASGRPGVLVPTPLDPLPPPEPMPPPAPQRPRRFACQRRLVRCCLFVATDHGHAE